MNREFLEQYDQLKLEVERYLQILQRAEEAVDRPARREQEIRELNVLRAGTFLVIYNLIEASIRSAIEEIHAQIQQREVKFEQLSSPLRREVIKGFKSRADVDRHTHLTSLDVAIVKESLSVDMMFTGNIDAKLIRKIGDAYGFETTAPPDVRVGSDLLPIKTNRNDLAHGFKSFETLGREYPTGDLIDIATRAMLYVGAILRNVDRYLEQEGYLMQRTPPELSSSNVPG